jgi:hypothetical protein
MAVLLPLLRVAIKAFEAIEPYNQIVFAQSKLECLGGLIPVAFGDSLIVNRGRECLIGISLPNKRNKLSRSIWLGIYAKKNLVLFSRRNHTALMKRRFGQSASRKGIYLDIKSGSLACIFNEELASVFRTCEDHYGHKRGLNLILCDLSQLDGFVGVPFQVIESQAR